MRSDDYLSLHRRSIDFPEDFWMERAKGIDWHRDFDEVLDFSDPPLARWFIGGETNLCHNAVDRHLPERGGRNALVYISSGTGEKREYTYRELHEEVNAFAGALKELGVSRGDRVVMYMPMMAEAVFAMLACVRLGAIHSFVFRGCAVGYLAHRIDDAEPKVVVTADYDMSGADAIPCKKFVDAGLDAARFAPGHVIVCRRGSGGSMPMTGGRDLDYADLRERYIGCEIPVEWVESSHPIYILHTSGTTGSPRLVQRDTGGHAVALTTSMRHVFAAKPGETMFAASGASDIGWVVGHSFIVYGPLLCGMASVVYEGLPARADPGVWWRIVEEYGVNTMLTSPTAIRALKKHGFEHMSGHDTSSLRNLFLAGEPPDKRTSLRVSESLGVAVRDTYWQTETGWPILRERSPEPEDEPLEAASFGFPCPGFDVRTVDRESGEEVPAGESGVLAIGPPLPPGCADAVRSNERFIKTYFSDFPRGLYSTFDWARRDEMGRYIVLGRANDVIKTPGQSFGTREIEEAINDHENVEEAAVVEGVASAITAYVVLDDGDTVENEASRTAVEREVKDAVERKVGTAARPDEVRFVSDLPRTRSGKMLHRCIRAIAAGREPGDISTIKNPEALEAMRSARPPMIPEKAEVIEHKGGKE